MRASIDPCACGLALEDRNGQAYNEQAFRHFLAVERRRASRASRSFLLLLVTLRRQTGMPPSISPAVAGRLFAGLALCVREIDFIGWYREQRVAGAVLTQGGMTDPNAIGRISERVSQVLTRSLSEHDANRLDVRVLQLCRRPKP